jgi:hypothetical protein
MAAGLTDHRWRYEELLTLRVTRRSAIYSELEDFRNSVDRISVSVSTEFSPRLHVFSTQLALECQLLEIS